MNRTLALLLTAMLLVSGCLGLGGEDIDPNDQFPDDDAAYLDTDGDGMPDVLDGVSTTGLVEDLDDDNDGYTDLMETSCGTNPLDETSTPPDNDGDKRCDDFDNDDDDDGTVDIADAFPFDASADTDTDGDGMPNVVVGTSTSSPALVEDLDDDNDGWSDLDEEACGTNPLVDTLKPTDSDGDGSCDSVSTDDDGDGVSDEEEGLCGSDPLDPNSLPADMDTDGVCDALDQEADGDGIDNDEEVLCNSDPMDATSTPADLDGDGVCDALDDDQDGDGVSDADDLYPRDPSKHEDVPGCIDENAFNFDTTANLDDGSCFDLDTAQAAYEAAMTGIFASESASSDMRMMVVMNGTSMDHYIQMEMLSDTQSLGTFTYRYDGGELVQVDRVQPDLSGDPDVAPDEETASFVVKSLYYLGAISEDGGWSHCEFDGTMWHCADVFDDDMGDQAYNSDSENMSMHQFTCANGDTIMLSQVNNGHDDCADASDEPLWQESTTFTCNDGTSIGLRMVNDGKADCDDGSDEVSVIVLFTCDDGTNIPGSYINDGYADCEGGEDEPMYDLDSSETSSFMCEDGTTVPLSDVNDGVDDCADGTDETPSGEVAELFAFPCDGEVGGDETISIALVNDGVDDCPNGEDEVTYDINGDEDSTFTCWNYWDEEAVDVIPLSWVNDGTVDCLFHDDELVDAADNWFGLEIDEEEDLMVYTGDCQVDGEDYAWPWVFVNDGVEDCDGATDEDDGTGTMTYTCDDGTVISFALLNDGSEDCADGDDEPDYVINSDYTCGDGELVPFDYVNDGESDCEDGSDEPTYDFEELSVFVCEDGSEIPLSDANDGYDDCAGGEDEPDMVEEEESSFDCASGDVIPLSLVNDGVSDCPAADDEPTYDPITQSETSTFQCPYSGETIPLSSVNDGMYDCEDYEDEPFYVEYDQNEFTCDDGDVISMMYVNDGDDNCWGGEDEPVYDMGQDISEVTCNDGSVITASQFMNGVADCADSSDEMAMYDCADGSDSIPLDYVNDGGADCQDESDESDAVDTSSATCYGGSDTLPTSHFGDGMNDCEDGWDEMDFTLSKDCVYEEGKGWMCTDLMFPETMDWTMNSTTGDNGEALMVLTGTEGPMTLEATFLREGYLLMQMNQTIATDEGNAESRTWTDAMDATLASMLTVDSSLDLHAPPFGVAFNGETMAAEDDRMFICDDETEEVPFSAINDGFEDCSDASDEPVYEDVEISEFYCSADDEFIPLSWVNDGEDDCSDGEDEDDTTGTRTYDCYEETILFSQVNDGTADCMYGEDEPEYEEDEISDWICDDGMPIRLSFVNDGYEDCDDGSDEAPSSEGHGYGDYTFESVGLAEWTMGSGDATLEVTFAFCETFTEVADPFGDVRYLVPSDCEPELARYTLEEIVNGDITGLAWDDSNENGVADDEDMLLVSEDFSLEDWNAMRLSTPDGEYTSDNPEVVLPAPGIGFAIVALLGAAMLVGRRD